MKILDRPQTVFLSGTDEMRPISNSLYEKLNALHFEPVWFKKRFDIENDDAIEECFNNVAKADRFIIMIGKTYGSIYPKTNFSITEQEFNIAYNYSKPALIFIQAAVYHQFNIYKNLKQKNKKILKSDLKDLGFEADPEIYEFIFRIQNKRFNGIRKVPWISQFETVKDIEDVIKDKWINVNYSSSPLKICFFGLDSAGKTSILIALKKKFNYEQEALEILPTRRIETERAPPFLGRKPTNFDFGGQVQYRDLYFRNTKAKQVHLLETNLLFYVIDVQDQKRYIEALEYYKKIINALNEIKEKPFIIILFHKYDPDLPSHEKEEIDKQVVILKYTLLEISGDFTIYFFKTSIFNILSLLDCYSSGLSLLLDENETLQVLFNEISIKNNGIMMSLFDNNGITIGEYYKPFLNASQKFKLYEYILNVQKMIKEDTGDTFNFLGNFENDEPFSGSIELIKIGGLTFYLLFIVEKHQKSEDILRSIETFKPQIESFFQQVTPNIF